MTTVAAPTYWFNIALKFTLEQEGGFSDLKNDSGGRTNLGIEESEARIFFHNPVFNIQKITVAQASEIYIERYWNTNGISLLPGPINMAVFDCGVNCGVVTAVKMLQSMVKSTPDGQIGHQTLNDLLYYTNRYGMAVAVSHYATLRGVHYRDIVRGNPGDVEFLDGWLNRNSACRALCDSYL